MKYEIDWKQVLGSEGLLFSSSELQELEQSLHRHSPRAVRLRPPISSDDLPFPSTQVPWFENGFVVEGEHRPGAYLHYAAGDYYIQDAGSMLALELCDVQPGHRICDTCSAPGGKTSGLLGLLDGTGLVVANEVISSRLAILQLALASSGYANYAVANLDVDRLGVACGSSFDRVLVDAPCTGQSMLAKGKQTLASFSCSQIEHSSARQKRILSAAASLVVPGGRIVYSTCSFSVAENEQVVEFFLEAHPEFQIVPHPKLAAWESPRLAGSYRLWPHRDPSAGAFAVALEYHGSKREDLSEKQGRVGKAKGGKWKRFKSEFSGIPLASETLGHAFWSRNGQVHMFPEAFSQSWIESAVAGVPVAIEKGNRWEPHFAAARLDSDLNKQAEVVELSSEQASGFVAGESIRIQMENQLPGWCIAGWEGRNLGWAKFSANTLKNHFPKPLRQAAIY